MMFPVSWIGDLKVGFYLRRDSTSGIIYFYRISSVFLTEIEIRIRRSGLNVD
jgi:hypothetical protein